MENFVYFFISNYSKLITRLYFGKVEVRGIERIPKEHPVIYSVNHQNAFMDALIVGSLLFAVYRGKCSEGLDRKSVV